MYYLIFYIFLYCNTDDIINKFYLSNYPEIINNELIETNLKFHYAIYNINLFALLVYSIYIIKHTFYYKLNKNYSFALALIYIKYASNILLNNNITLFQYETYRNIMWVFATPIMIKMYCDVNNLNIQTTNIQYHIIPTVINVFIYPYKTTIIYNYVTVFCWLLLSVFMKTLYEKRDLQFTNIFIYIWLLFGSLNIFDNFGIVDKYTINIFYSLADLISKLMTGIIIHDFNEKEITQLNNMDLQSVEFITYMIKQIKIYKKENAILTPKCNKFIEFITNRLIVKIPENKKELEQELFKKILPFNFDKNYIENVNTNANSNVNANTKQFNTICVLFTDIVNYTELANKFDDKIIFDLLNSIYIKFDKTIKKYSYLQKIETIGDAYMVVGDIFRTSINNKLVIKEIILFAFDIINDIKTIKTPDNKPLSLRVGINIGDVSIGILGNEIPRLCVVGNTVNMAARLQSTADIDTIQVSSFIYEELKDIDFDIKLNINKKESVFLKNIGSVTTYNVSQNL